MGKIRYAGAPAETETTPVRGTPDMLQRMLLGLMSDGRERTTHDFATALKTDTSTLGIALRRLRRQKLIDYDVVYNTRVWRHSTAVRKSS